ncbi:MAG: hypothetical protein IJZ22_08985 [Bacteroidaceae bacterium]|nr:hypothetical protein [Bacteroidaceae bacterium]
MDNAIKEYDENANKRPNTFLGDIAKALKAKKHGSNSQYATFEAVNGKVFTIRLANHNATVSTFDNHDESEGISIVVTAQGNNGITNDGNAHIVEFFYDAIKLRKADGKPLVEILKSIKQALYSGEYRDTTGLAVREEVNSDIRFRVANWSRNRGYTQREDGSRISVRAADAEAEGAFTAGTFRKVYGVSKADFDALVEIGAIVNSEWHHTGANFKKSDFYSWSDRGDMDYTDGVPEEGSLGDVYSKNKKDISRLVKEYQQKEWEYEDKRSEVYLPGLNDFASRVVKLNAEEQADAEREHAEISNRGEELGSSYARRLMHEEVDARYARIARERFERENPGELERLYEEEYGESIAFNRGLAERNNAAEEHNRQTTGKEATLLKIADILGVDARNKVEGVSHVAREKAKREQRKVEAETIKQSFEAEMQRKQKALDKWLAEQRKKGGIKDVVRIPKKDAPEFFVTEKEEMNGRYGWFEASTWRYNLPVYVSGMEFANKRLYDSYQKRVKEIRDAQHKFDFEYTKFLYEENNDGEEMFESTSIEDDFSARDSVGSYTDDELAMESDPVSKVLGKPRGTRKQRREFAERERQRMAERVEELAKKLNLSLPSVDGSAAPLQGSGAVEIVTDASTLNGKQATSKGFYSKSTGKITIVIPNHSSVADVEQTLLHEAVAHYGLRKLFGEHFDTFLDNVYNNADESVRRSIVELAAKNGWDFRTATEEYLASLAENTNFENAHRNSWWQQIKRFFMDMLAKVGVKFDAPLTDNELRYILWRSYENLAEPGRYRSILGEAADVAKQYELGVGNYGPVQAGSVNVAEDAEGYSAEEQQIIDRAKADGSYMKAPNGKPTKLTPKQWVQVRTEAFKKWFGDWKLAATETPIHNSKGTFANLAEAEKWAKENLQGQSRVNKYTGEEISIGKKSVSEMLNEKTLKQSHSVNTHLAALQSVLDFIETGIPAEVHSDTHGRGFDVMRLYNAIEIEGKVYRVKSSVRKVKQGDKFYTYEIQEMELIEERGANPNREGETPHNGNTSNNSITGAKLLNGVKKTNSNEDILQYSKVVDENGEPMVVYHGTGEEFTTFEMQDGSMGRGAYFTSNWDEAAEYAMQKQGVEDIDELDESKVLEVFLNVRDADNITHSRFSREDIEVLATEPSQIKSATDNVGTFDVENDDILFREGAGGERRGVGVPGTARELYDNAVRVSTADNNVKWNENVPYRLQESYQDSMLALKKFQEAVTAETGNEIRSFELKQMIIVFSALKVF